MLLNTLEMGWTLLPPPTKVSYAEARDVPPPVHHRNLSRPSPRFDDQHTCDLAVRLLCPSDPARLGVAVSFARFLAGMKVVPMKRTIKLAKNRASSERKLAKKKLAPTKAEVKTKVVGKTVGAPKKQVREKNQSVDTVAFAQEGRGARSGQQSGDLQGLSNVQGADSESVDELLEEGNWFEAEVVKGVEEAGDSDAAEVRTHEVPQDDAPRRRRRAEVHSG